jgi:diaminohydroxyphosphoribosylaminopyrimidine deaminase/5-amino-6-(5-phosphoribosylamino)uracil reductase
MVGAGTARDDDPMLTVRDFGPVAQPVRVILSGELRLDGAEALAASAREVPLWLVHGPDAPTRARQHWEEAGARLIPVAPGVEGGLDPVAALSALGAAGLTRVFCEGGGRLAASLLRAGAVDEIVTFSAGLALGSEGRPMLGPMVLEQLADAPRNRLVSVEPVGADAMQVWRRDA